MQTQPIKPSKGSGGKEVVARVAIASYQGAGWPSKRRLRLTIAGYVAMDEELAPEAKERAAGILAALEIEQADRDYLLCLLRDATV